ncbi:hypothetical protein [Ktedonospora formicarum]|uniref:Uncharacterized protein n=1 Tax=Ktedonospora formicarum TaxID=2778364 RepID=A0A8J3IA51_9CHLR|nr:hypothetical protein [Ktedonospora formicarum]GHO50048.1 hypothetical protein KSX_82110 [Ktedonospora formicarum]
MRPVRWHGAWGGRDPLSDMSAVVAPQSGPWVILTRATLRLGCVKAFLDAVPAVAARLRSQPTLLNSVGVG